MPTKRNILPAALLLACVALFAGATQPKHDFRGAWIQTIFQGYDKRSTAENKAYLTGLLDQLESAGINAVIFQVRPRSDAFYQSTIEPWSASLTGKYGKAPEPFWDPLEFMVSECHKRGMELHAWLNPYRGPATGEVLPASHPMRRHPERFVRYGKTHYYEPSLKANRDHICRIVADILTRYDVDGIHFDDYFYPYPIAKEQFPDAEAYRRAHTKLSKADWRRRNVDLLIEQVSRTIADVKPWVRFGISPFGIWRNASSDPRGSNTRGLQNYDDLYADVPRWAANGLIDYQIPQLYWEIGHKAAPYDVLCHWWAENGHGRHVYIGQDAEKTAKFNELSRKLSLAEAHRDGCIRGNCWWYAASLPTTIASELRNGAYRTKALVPEYLWKSVEPAARPTPEADGDRIIWHPDPTARRWVIYRFNSVAEVDTENPEAICGVTYMPQWHADRPGVYVITALDFANSESLPSKPIEFKDK